MEVAEKVVEAVQKKDHWHALSYRHLLIRRTRGGMPVQYVLQATNIEKLQEVLPKFMTKVYEKSGIPDGRRKPEVQQA